MIAVVQHANSINNLQPMLIWVAIAIVVVTIACRVWVSVNRVNRRVEEHRVSKLPVDEQGAYWLERQQRVQGQIETLETAVFQGELNSVGRHLHRQDKAARRHDR